jgi:hypothetical protein
MAEKNIMLASRWKFWPQDVVGTRGAVWSSRIRCSGFQLAPLQVALPYVPHFLPIFAMECFGLG